MKITTSYNPTHISFRSLDVGDCFYCDNNKDIFIKIKDFCLRAVLLNNGRVYEFENHALVTPVECELVAKIK